MKQQELIPRCKLLTQAAPLGLAGSRVLSPYVAAEAAS